MRYLSLTGRGNATLGASGDIYSQSHKRAPVPYEVSPEADSRISSGIVSEELELAKLRPNSGWPKFHG